MNDTSSRERPLVIGIVNLSRDSFSDGGRIAEPSQAADRVEELLECGAHWVELGAASSHPDASDVSPADEIAELDAVLDLVTKRIDRIGVDTWKPAVQRHCIERKVAFINDIAGFGDPSVYDDLADDDCALVLMHSVQRGKATRTVDGASTTPEAVTNFLCERAERLVAAGVARHRIIADPGMGFFLGDTPEPSFAVLAALGSLRADLGLPVLVSVSRKSFLGAVSGRPVAERGAATLAAELYAASKGVDYIRTHDVGALADGLAIWATSSGADKP